MSSIIKAFKICSGVPVLAQQKQIRLVSMRTQVRSLASLSGLRIRHCCKLWRRSTDLTWIQSCCVAVMLAGSYSSNSNPSLGTSTCLRCSPTKQKKNTHFKKTKNQNKPTKNSALSTNAMSPSQIC